MIRNLAAAGAVAIALAGGFAFATPASAQQTGVSRSDSSDRIEKRFKHFDRNGDGVIDRSELDRRLSRAFDRMDKNKDGAIDRAEATGKVGRRGRSNPDRMAKRIQRLDSNRDGRVTREEYLAHPPKWFTRGDANRDGSVSRQEFEDFMTQMAERRAKRAGRKKNEM